MKVFGHFLEEFRALFKAERKNVREKERKEYWRKDKIRKKGRNRKKEKKRFT